MELPAPLHLPLSWRGVPIEFIEAGALAAAIDPGLPWQALQADDEQLLQAALLHDRVICDLFRQQPVLPLQFGTVFVSPDGLVQHLLRHGERYRERIRALTGMGEYTLKLAPQLLHPESDDFEQTDWEREQLQSQLKARYGSLVDGAARRGVERVHLLIPVCEENLLRQRVTDWQSEYHCWQLDVQGPLPPYHFA
ncbi:GvpL/GvpF family gas vesicle protein [Gloeobacter kilaueensis]|uniref:GvpL/GvpF family gas vesicle protein n=1 Tax=Gloeobacter kilaueensis TaxID=1416614 RepID=UPI001651AC5F